jgi:hypothetical protein
MAHDDVGWIFALAKEGWWTVTERAAVNLPEVSVVSTTHNHEAYIRVALDSIVAEQTG